MQVAQDCTKRDAHFPSRCLCLSSTGMPAIELHMKMFLVLHKMEIYIKWSVMRIHAVESGILP